MCLYLSYVTTICSTLARERDTEIGTKSERERGGEREQEREKGREREREIVK